MLTLVMPVRASVFHNSKELNGCALVLMHMYNNGRLHRIRDGHLLEYLTYDLLGIDSFHARMRLQEQPMG